MAQAELNICKTLNVNSSMDVESGSKRKVGFNLDGRHHVSVFKNESGHGVINIRQGTRSVTISKDILFLICGLRETLVNCLEFIEA